MDLATITRAVLVLLALALALSVAFEIDPLVGRSAVAAVLALVVWASKPDPKDLPE